MSIYKDHTLPHQKRCRPRHSKQNIVSKRTNHNIYLPNKSYSIASKQIIISLQNKS